MRALLSPYELDAWSPSAMAALSLFDAAATLRPEVVAAGPGEGSGNAGAAELKLRDVPAMAALYDQWHWTSALWRAGVLVPDADGWSVLHEARATATAFRDDPRLAPIQRLAGQAWHEDATQAGEALAHDLLKRGANPSIHLPVIAAIESLAIRTGSVLCRSEGAGMLSRLERRGQASVLARFALPALIGGDGHELMSARQRLSEVREALVQSLHDTTAAMARSAKPAVSLLEAAEAYSGAFQRAYSDVPVLRGAHAHDGIRRTTLVIAISATTPAPTLGAAARLASLVGGRRHDRMLASAARQSQPAERPHDRQDDPLVAPAAQEHLLIATVKRVSWEPVGG